MIALRRFAMQPLPGVRITLVSRETHTPYSGMLPGYVAGHYAYDDMHIDLRPLSSAAGARLIAAEVLHVDLHANCIEVDGHPPLRFDVVSLNCGAAPGFGALSPPPSAIPVKPIGLFIPRWQALRDAALARSPGDPPLRLAVVGGGAGGVELALAVHHALGPAAARISLVTAGARLLDGHSQRVQRRFANVLASRGIDVLTNFIVGHVDAAGVSTDGGRRLAGDYVLWVTGVEAPAWLRRTDLALDGGGFVSVGRTLRSVSHANVFAAGDVAAMADQPRPKSGVIAVRQGRVLADNLRRAVLGRPLRRFRAQRRMLSLISEGRRSATASRGAFSAHGDWVWRWKDRIDRRFMARFESAAVGAE